MMRLPLRRRIYCLFFPAVLSILLVLNIWFGKYRPFQLILLSIPVIILIGDIRLKLFISSMIISLFIFIGLMVGDTMTLSRALFSIPLMVLLGFYLYWSEATVILTISFMLHFVIEGSGLFPKFPFSEVEMEMNLSEDTGLYDVYVKHPETEWECLIWESETEEEASDMMEIFQEAGIG